MKLLTTINDIAIGFAKWCGISTAIVMTVMIFMQVVYRYVLADSLSWSEELARYMFIWSVAMGSALALKTRSHIGVELVVERLPKSLAYPAKIIASFVNLMFFALLIWYGFDMVIETMDQESAALSLPMGYVYLAVPLSGIVLFICEIKNTLDDFLGNKGNDESVKGE
jgi:TRAP-type transport system small permease protein